MDYSACSCSSCFTRTLRAVGHWMACEWPLPLLSSTRVPPHRASCCEYGLTFCKQKLQPWGASSCVGDGRGWNVWSKSNNDFLHTSGDTINVHNLDCE
jgi:hypothetical protein